MVRDSGFCRLAPNTTYYVRAYATNSAGTGYGMTLSFTTQPLRTSTLTNHIWVSLSLLANGVDATGQGELLKGFAGDSKFNPDGTGTFGTNAGTWTVNVTEERLTITSPSLSIPMTLNIIELTSTSFKLQGVYPDLNNLTGPPIEVQMTYKAK